MDGVWIPLEAVRHGEQVCGLQVNDLRTISPLYMQKFPKNVVLLSVLATEGEICCRTYEALGSLASPAEMGGTC